MIISAGCGSRYPNLAYLICVNPGAASVRPAILDCCFAGQATQTLASGSEPGLADIAHVEGVYTLAATTRNRTAHVLPPGQQDTACTSFTGELRDLIHSGIPGKAPRLTFTDIYPVLRERLRGKGLPLPSQRGNGAIGQFYFSANAAVAAEPAQIIPAEPHDAHPALPQEDAGPVQPGQSRHIGLVADALRAINSITGEGAKAQVLAMVADAVADRHAEGRVRTGQADQRRVRCAGGSHVRGADLCRAAPENCSAAGPQASGHGPSTPEAARRRTAGRQPDPRRSP
jgi:hypothetical protein